MLITAAGALALIIIVAIIASIGKGVRNKQEEKQSGYGYLTIKTDTKGGAKVTGQFTMVSPWDRKSLESRSAWSM